MEAELTATESRSQSVPVSARSILVSAFIVLAALGLADAAYLTYEHYTGVLGCTGIGGCETVLKSSYATVGSIPVALLGVVYYGAALLLAVLYVFLSRRGSARRARYLLFAAALLPALGIIASARFVYLQFYVLDAICPFCMTSAAITTLLLLVSFFIYTRRRVF